MPFGDYCSISRRSRGLWPWPCLHHCGLLERSHPCQTGVPRTLSQRSQKTTTHRLTAVLFDSSPEAAATFISGSYMKGSDSHHWRADTSRFILRDLATLVVDISHAKWRSERTAVTPDHGICWLQKENKRIPSHQGQTVPQRCARHRLHTRALDLQQMANRF